MPTTRWDTPLWRRSRRSRLRYTRSPLSRVTSGALGYTMQVDEKEHFLMTKEELENKIATFTGGLRR